MRTIYALDRLKLTLAAAMFLWMSSRFPQAGQILPQPQASSIPVVHLRPRDVRQTGPLLRILHLQGDIDLRQEYVQALRTWILTPNRNLLHQHQHLSFKLQLERQQS